MPGKRAIYHLTLNARLTLAAHNLNSEGAEGNVMQTRVLPVVDDMGNLHHVNAISGDMFKHIQAEHLYRLMRERGDIPMCAGCKEFNANRINADPSFIQQVSSKEWNDAQALEALLQRCAIDDMEGNLITAGGRSLGRKSVTEFSWVMGVPNEVETTEHFHVKFANERAPGKRQQDREATEANGSNLGQSIFHRPASSGIYAVVVALELARIGFNDRTRRYDVEQDERERRAELLLESLLYAFLDPRGASRNTQNPHLVNFAGVIAISTQASTPAPTVSPIKPTFREEIERIRAALDPLHPGAVELLPFEDLAQFGEQMAALIRQSSPYALQ